MLVVKDYWDCAVRVGNSVVGDVAYCVRFRGVGVWWGVGKEYCRGGIVIISYHAML